MVVSTETRLAKGNSFMIGLFFVQSLLLSIKDFLNDLISAIVVGSDETYRSCSTFELLPEGTNVISHFAN